MEQGTVKRLTVDSIKDDQPIYVKNKSKGDYLLTLYRTDGSSELAPIPKTYIPILVTNFAEPSMFRRSSDFRKAIAKGMLVLISEEEAIKELSNTSAIIELERLRKDVFSDIDFAQSHVEVTPLQAIKNVTNENVSLKVKDIMIRSDISEDDKFALLLAEYEDDEMNRDDFEFISVTAEDKSKIANWAKKRIDEDE